MMCSTIADEVLRLNRKARSRVSWPATSLLMRRNNNTIVGEQRCMAAVYRSVNNTLQYKTVGNRGKAFALLYLPIPHQQILADTELAPVDTRHSPYTYLSAYARTRCVKSSTSSACTSPLCIPPQCCHHQRPAHAMTAGRTVMSLQ